MYTKNKKIQKKSSEPKKNFALNSHNKKESSKLNKIISLNVHKQKNLTIEDLKNQIKAWATNENIPGKIQSIFTKNTLSENSDWKFIIKNIASHNILVIDSPAKEMQIPDVVNKINEQLHKDVLRIFRKTIRQILFRATGDGRFALVVQANCHGKNSAHGYKIFSDFIKRECKEIISCHLIQCTPDKLFNPSFKPNSHVDLKCSFGTDYMPLSTTGFCMHVLDWAPRMKDTWLDLPMRIKDAIHPANCDKFFEFYSGCSYISASLASFFSQVESLDCRETSMLSTRVNSHKLTENKIKFHRTTLNENFFFKFFNKKENEGKWTFYFNLPEGEFLSTPIIQSVAHSRPERILLQITALEIATKQIKQFRKEGYLLRKIIPLCLEPNSSKIELLLLFVPDRAGLLNLNPSKKRHSHTVQRPQERSNMQKEVNIAHFVQKKPSFRERKD